MRECPYVERLEEDGQTCMYIDSDSYCVEILPMFCPYMAEDLKRIEQETDKAVEELVQEYGCDGIQNITAEKEDSTWVIKLHTWDGCVFTLRVADIKKEEGEK